MLRQPDPCRVDPRQASFTKREGGSAGFRLFRPFWRNIKTMRFSAMTRTSANMPRTNRHLVKRFVALPQKKTPLRMVPATALKGHVKPLSFPGTIAGRGAVRQPKSRGTSGLPG